MITISLCMIVKNEEALLARCLDSVGDAVDEIIIVDTGSTDGTKKIAEMYTDRVFDFEWTDNFSTARNFAYDKAGMDYQMWLDADDVLPEAEREKLKSLKCTLPSETDIVTMKYHLLFDTRGEPVFSSTRERLTRREKGYRWQYPIHECIPLSGRVFRSDIAVCHQKPPSPTLSRRNLELYEGLEKRGELNSPRMQYYFARELKDHSEFAKSAYYFERFLEGGLGWSEDNIDACRALGVCYRELGEDEKVLPALLHSFRYGSPRAETCCEIGYWFMKGQDYSAALQWFRIAAGLRFSDSPGFVQSECYGYIPNIESCVCCCFLGRFEEAKRFNALAKSFKPDSAAAAQNEIILAHL